MNRKFKIFIILLFCIFTACSDEPDTAEEVLEEFLTKISNDDCERAYELATGYNFYKDEICEGNNDEILSIRCETENDNCHCNVRYTKETAILNLPYGRYTHNNTYSMDNVNGDWKVSGMWKSINWPEEYYDQLSQDENVSEDWQKR